jgi:dienelactone hydrolase
MPSPAGLLAGWRSAPFSAVGLTHEFFTRDPDARPGPGVVLLPEISGMTPALMGLADHLVGEGFSVAVRRCSGNRGGRCPGATP